MRFLALSIFLAPIVAHAAVSDVVLTAQPENPEPGAPVVITATPVGFSPQSTVFTWILNDEPVSTGLGVQTFRMNAPALGETSTVRLSINDEERAAPLMIRPGRVTIEWEGITAKPPFYTGRPLVGGQGALKAVAIQELLDESGRAVPAGSTLFTWRLNGAVLSKQSGYGANQIIVEPPFYDSPFTLSVEARGGGMRATHGVTIRPAEPSMVIYESTPLAGVLFTNAVGQEFSLDTSEATFIAYPLHTSDSLSLQYQWKLNGGQISVGGTDPRIAVFKKTGEGTGVYKVSVGYTSERAFLDLFERSFLLHF